MQRKWLDHKIFVQYSDTYKLCIIQQMHTVYGIHCSESIIERNIYLTSILFSKYTLIKQPPPSDHVFV